MTKYIYYNCTVALLLLISFRSQAVAQNNPASIHIFFFKGTDTVYSQDASMSYSLGIVIHSNYKGKLVVPLKGHFWIIDYDLGSIYAKPEFETIARDGKDSTVFFTNTCLYLRPPDMGIGGTLNYKQTINYVTDLRCYLLNFEKNRTYKFRLCCKLSSYNKNVEDIYSNWLTIRF
jgi:hypothetical protein